MAIFGTKRLHLHILLITAVTIYNILKNAPSSLDAFSLYNNVFDYLDDLPTTTLTHNQSSAPNRNTTEATSSLDSVPYLSMYGSHRVDPSFASLPEWLQTYFEWHHTQTQNSRNDNTTTTRYIVLTCLRRCGGLSDRLRPLPFYLLYASLVPRVICIHWTTPFFGLEHFLVPPVDSQGRSVDWRCPADVAEALVQKNKRNTLSVNCNQNNAIPCHQRLIRNTRRNKNKYFFLDLQNYAVERINLSNQLYHLHSYEHRMPLLSQWWFVESMGDIFRVMFEPVPALAQSINETMTALGLRENEYVSVHLRARYPVNGWFDKLDLGGGLKMEGRIKKFLSPVVDNALRCGAYLAPNHTIYFASDSHEVVADTLSRDVYLLSGGRHVRPVALRRNKEPLHSNVQHPGSEVRDFFPIFEDLLIMGGSRCVAHGVGGFGSFGAGLSGNRCRAIHRNYRGRAVECPNGYTNPTCVSTVEQYEGNMLFGSVVDDEKRRLSSPVCDTLDSMRNTSF